MMKLGLMSYLMAKTWDRPTVYRIMKETGLEGFEARTERQHGHGIEVALTKEQRAAVKAEAAREGIVISCVASGCMFHWADEAKRRAEIENAKRHLELARDLGVPRVRVFPNDIVEGENTDVTCKRVAQSLLELGQYAQGLNIDVLLEMHGKLGKVDTAEKIMQQAEHPRIGLVFNSQPRDLVDGSLTSTWKRVRKYVRHVHVHEFSNRKFPYRELFLTLKKEGYEGYLSLELEEAATPDEKLGTTILGLSRVFFDEVLKNAR
jgi:sugar phosphate isomerase/epimerase